MPDPARWTLPQMQTLAARGLGRVDLWGSRGASLVTIEEIEAMAGMLAAYGLRPIYPGAGEPRPIDTPLNPLKGPADV